MQKIYGTTFWRKKKRVDEINLHMMEERAEALRRGSYVPAAGYYPGSSLETKVETKAVFVFAALVKAFACFNKNEKGETGACFSVGSAVAKVFSSEDTSGEGAGSGAGSGAEPTENRTNRCTKVEHGSSIVNAIIQVLVKGMACIECVFDAVMPKKAGALSNKFGAFFAKEHKGRSKSGLITTIVSLLGKLVEGICCLEECNCQYTNISCKVDKKRPKGYYNSLRPGVPLPARFQSLYPTSTSAAA